MNAHVHCQLNKMPLPLDPVDQALALESLKDRFKSYSLAITFLGQIASPLDSKLPHLQNGNNTECHAELVLGPNKVANLAHFLGF